MTWHVGPNRGAEFEAALAAAGPPDVVVFDRFMAEEAFSFRVRAACPSAARVLDMQDLHALRDARQAAVKEGVANEAAAVKAAKKERKRRPGEGGGTRGSNAASAAPHAPSLVEAALAAVPSAGDDHLSRELAAVHRSDLTLVCSPTEARLMRDRFGVPGEKLVLASFFCDPAQTSSPGFEPRAGFMTIGTFYHPPNVDSVRWMATEVWPLIRKELPAAEMRVYGAYPTEGIKQLHAPDKGFRVEGFAPTVEGAMAGARVLLAPLRFGAGIKGKIVDAWIQGLPVVTTPVGAEGMVPGVDQLWTRGGASDGSDWGGRWCAVDAAGVARDAVALHEDRLEWERARAAGTRLVDDLFPAQRNLAVVREAVEGLFAPTGLESEGRDSVGESGCRTRLEALRSVDFYGAALWHHTVRSTEYFSRWIEVKETGKDSSVLLPEGTPLPAKKDNEDR